MSNERLIFILASFSQGYRYQHNIDDIIDEFARCYPRRMQLANILCD